MKGIRVLVASPDPASIQSASNAPASARIEAPAEELGDVAEHER